MLKWDGYNKLLNTIILWCNVRYQKLNIYQLWFIKSYYSYLILFWVKMDP